MKSQSQTHTKGHKSNIICELYEISYKPVCRKFLSILFFEIIFGWFREFETKLKKVE